MVKKIKKCMAVILSATMIMGSGIDGNVVSTFAGDGLDKCGNNLSTSIGGGPYTLSIGVIDKDDASGREMTNFYYEPEGTDAFPWSGYRESIEKIEIGDGVKTIAGDAFRNMTILETVEIPTSVYYIGRNAFLGCTSLKNINYKGTKVEWDELMKTSDYTGADFSVVNVNCLGGMGIAFDLDEKVFTINTLAPLPGKLYEYVSAYTTVIIDRLPVEGDPERMYSEGIITYYYNGNKCGITVYERWTEHNTLNDDFVEIFSNDTRYHYMLAFDMTHSGFSDEEISKLEFKTPNVDFEYVEKKYDADNKILYLFASYLNGKDNYETKDFGEYNLNLRDGEVITYHYNDMLEYYDIIGLRNCLDALEVEKKIIVNQMDSSNYCVDVDKDGNNDFILYSEYTSEGLVVNVYELESCSVKGELSFSLSQDTIIRLKANQNNTLGFFDKLIIQFDEKKESASADKDDKKEDNKKSDDNSYVPLHKKGEKISDKNYIYEIIKGETLGVTSLPEVKVIGLKNKSLKQIKIATEVTIDDTTYMVTAIDKNAFKGNKKITKVTIGKNVKSIGAGAFKNCKKLKQVRINSKLLKKVGKKAFYRKGGKKIKFFVPKSKKKSYKKLFKRAKIKKFVVK